MAASKGKQTAVLLLVTVALVAPCVAIGVINADDDSTVVPAPTAEQVAATVPILEQAAETQGTCYGWQLLERWGQDTPVSVGSNLGDGVPVRDDPRCPRWVEVTGTVNYTSASSEMEDSAYFKVATSEDEYAGLETGLTRLGLDEQALIDDPGWAITRAAVMLPLLTAESGTVTALPTARPDLTASYPQLPAAGSDLWRDRWVVLLVGAGFLLVTVLLFVLGWHQRGRQRAEAAQRIGPAHRDARTGAGPHPLRKHR